MSPRSLISILAMMACASLVSAQEASAVASMTVTGQGTAEAPATQVRLVVGVTVSAATLDEAKKDAEARYTSIIKALEGLGLDKTREFHTSGYNVQVQWSSPQRRGNTANERPKIIGYQVSATVQVTTGKLDMAGTILERSMDAGANDIKGPWFSLKNEQAIRKEAITKAAMNAMSDAGTLTQATDTRISRILNMNIDNAAIQPVAPMRMARAEMYGSSDSNLALTPRMVTVNADVTIVFEIEPAG